MANLVACFDRDVGRRSSFMAAVTGHVAPFSWLPERQHELGDFVMLWAAGPRAPISLSASDSSLCFVAGLPRDLAGQRVTAEMSEALAPAQGPVRLEGYFGAVHWDATRGLSVATDLLGLFPIYYWHRDDVMLVGTSPELFRRHPAFETRVCERAIVSMLLVMHPLGGDTLWQDVRRLAPGATLVWRAGRALQELECCRDESPALDLPLSGCIHQVDEALGRSISRDLPEAGTSGLLLSGGLDSRLVGGYLRELGAPVTALTLGTPGDIELRCARDAAVALGFSQLVTETPPERYTELAMLQTRWEHGLNGSNTVVEWDLPAQVADLPRVVFTGYVMDAVVGGSHISWASAPNGDELTFSAFWRRMNAMGFTPDVLNRLLRPRLRPLIEEVVDAAEREYNALSDLPSRRAWLFDLRYRQRHHVARGAWIMSFGAWPVLPVLDAKVLEVCARVPAAALAERVLQRQLLVKRFPDLASIPLDRNSARAELLRPSLKFQIRQFLSDRLANVRRQRDASPRYYRVFDINGPGWRRIRHMSEPSRYVLEDYMEPSVLEGVVPGPGVHIPVSDGIIDASGPKTVLGLQRWLSLQFGTRNDTQLV